MKSKLPLVSVAIVTYNQKEYLKECIESVLMQDYENIEIVVADDGSTDGTPEMLLDYKKKFPNKFVVELSKKNQGITKNSNLAHFSCKGKYIAWMGGDDLMLQGKISKQVEYMEQNYNCTISYHNLDVFESKTNKTIDYFNKTKKISGDIRSVLKFGTFNGACSTMVRTCKTPKYGFDERIPIASDWLYWAETLLNGGTINYIDNVLGRYRRHQNNITSQSIDLSCKIAIDHMNACNILLIKVPQFSKEISFRHSELLRKLRHIDKNNYFAFTIASFRIGLNLKSFISFVLYYISFGKIRV